MVLFVKYKNGHVENYKIKSFTMVNSTIRIKTDDNILYLIILILKIFKLILKGRINYVVNYTTF